MITDYKLAFWMLIAYIVGRLSKSTFYIGSDKESYDKADFGLWWEKGKDGRH